MNIYEKCCRKSLYSSAARITFDICLTSFVSCLKLNTSAGSSDGVWHYDLIGTLPSDAHFDHLDESFVDCDTFLGRGLKVQHVIILLAPSSSFVAVHFSLRLSVHLVADENEWEILGIIRSSIFNEALLPLIKGIKTRCVGQIKSESAAISSSIEGES